MTFLSSRIFILFLGTFSLLFFSGCQDSTDEPATIQKERAIQVQAEGTIISQTNDFRITTFFLVNDQDEVLYQLQSKVEDLKEYTDQKALISGIKSTERSTSPFLIDVYKIELFNPPVPKTKTPFTWGKKGLQGVLPIGWSAQEAVQNIDSFLVIKNEDKKDILEVSFLPDTDIEEIDVESGVEITINSKEAIRISKGKNTTIQMIESPFLNLEFFGAAEEKFLFYEFLSSLSFIETKNEENKGIIQYQEENTEEKTAAPKDEEEIEIKRVINDQHEKVQNYIKQNIFLLSPNFSLEGQETPQITRYIFDEESLVSIEYLWEGKKYRTVFSYHFDMNNITVEAKAYYNEGINTTWILIEGNPQITQGTQTVYNPNDKKSLFIPENFSLYVSTHFDFSIAYPKSMYYSAEGKNENQLAAVYFSSVPATPENAFISIKILDESREKERELLSENIIEIPRNENSHFQISATDEEQYLIAKQMASTLSTSLSLF